MALPVNLPAIKLSRTGVTPLIDGRASTGKTGALAKMFSKHVVILSRDVCYYTDTVVSLKRHRDIRAYLRSNAPLLCPFPGWQASYISHTLATTGQASRSRLQCWFYDPGLLAKYSISSAHMALPEDWLIANATQNPTLYRIDSTVKYWLYASSGIVKGSQIITEPEAFPQDKEFPEITQAPLLPLDDKEKTILLRHSLGMLQLKDLTGFTKLPAQITFPPVSFFKQWGLYTVTAMAVWLSAGSSVLVYERNMLEERQAELATPLREIITDNQKEELLRSKLHKLLPLFNDGSQPNRLWPLLSELPTQGTQFSRLVLTGKQLVLTGETESASALLATLSTLDWVESAEFTTPVSRHKNAERFNLKISIKDSEPQAGQPSS